MIQIKNLKFKIAHNKRGFTMVELLLYMAFLTILVTILTSLFTAIVDVQLDSQSISSVEQDGKYIISRLTYDIQRADSINTPAIIGAQSSSLVLTIDSVSNTYNISGGNLQLTNNLGTNNLNGYDSSISNFTIDRIGNPGGIEDTLKISFTVTSRTIRQKGLESHDYTTTIALRRK